MTNSSSAGIYFIVEFDWPSQITPNMYQAAANLHNTLEKSSWMKEILAGFGGVGRKYQSIWIFKFSSFGDIDALLDQTSERKEVKAYSTFFEYMKVVNTTIKQETTFIH